MAKKRGKSEKKTTFWGKEYVQHYDSKGKKSGRSERKETLFGKKYTQHYDSKGEKRGRSEKKETWTGRKYTQKYDAKGDKRGTSENKTRFFGKKYTQHYDQEGNKTDWSERKETFFGRKFRQRYGEEPRRHSATRGPSGSYYSRSSSSSLGTSTIRPASVLALVIGGALLLGLISLVKNFSPRRSSNSGSAESLGDAYINTLQLNLRRGPGKEYGVITRLTQGSSVSCLERSRNAHGEVWLRVRAGSSEGWVNEEYISRNAPASVETSARAFVEQSTANQTQPDAPLSNDSANRIAQRLPAPRLLSPGDGIVMNHYPRTTRLEWELVPGAETYTVEIQFLGGNVWNDLTEFLQNQGYVGYTPPVKLAQTTFSLNWVGINPGRWRVWAVDPAQKEGRKSEWREFRFTR